MFVRVTIRTEVTRVERSPDRPTTRCALLLALLAVLLAGCEGSTTTEFVPGSQTPTLPPGRVVEITRNTTEIVRDVQVGHDPLLAVPAEQSVWTADLDDGGVSRVDIVSGQVTSPTAGEVVGIASDGEDVWVATDSNELRRLDGRTGDELESFTLADRPLFEPRDAGFLVVASGSVWMTVPAKIGDVGPQALWRIDPSTGEVGSKIPIGSNPLPPVVADGAIWITTEETFMRVDVHTEMVRRLGFGPFPGPAVGGGGSVWIESAGTVYGLDPATGRLRSSFDFAGDARGLAWVDGKLWIATPTGVEVVDPSDGTLVQSVDLAPPSDDEGPLVLIPIGSSVWVAIETQ
jgi:outer membrane protein assembly factor BamB